MEENLFAGLPPPSSSSSSSSYNSEQTQRHKSSKLTFDTPKDLSSPPVPLPPPALKSALKKPKPPAESLPAPLPPPDLKSALKRTKFPSESSPACLDVVPEKKKARFKTTTDASEAQVIKAMQKIASHIKTSSKFGKASKLAIQLIQAGSVKPGTSDHFFAILKAAMSSPLSCTDVSLRADYHALFSAAQDAIGCFDRKQKNLMAIWTIRAVVANDLYTDDSFVFSKAASRVKETISSLPIATEAEDFEEADALKDEHKESESESLQKQNESSDNLTEESVKEESEYESLQKQNESSDDLTEENVKEESDPFGLDALIPSTSKKDDKSLGKRDVEAKNKDEEEQTKQFLKSQRKALIHCLEIAAHRYKLPWCQTVIDILVKHAFDNVSRFTARQRDAIGKLWASIREQQTRRKQGKSVTGKLDVNAFEYLQQKYASEKISIRHAVGGGAGRRAETWLG